jgi:EamA domain-containing membrane protein RarD
MRLFDYIIVCKSPDFKNVDRISQFMLLLSVLGYSFGIYKGLFPKPALIIAIMTSVICWWIFCWYQKKKGGVPYYRLGLLFASWGWFLMPNALIISGIYLIGALFERQVKFPYEIAFDPAGIVINTFPKKHFPWIAIQNAIIKDDVITIDFKNNKLIQKDINEPVSESVTTEFNTFCAAQIEISKQITSQEQQ